MDILVHNRDAWNQKVENARQGPLLAAAGADVTVYDNSPAQLEQDRFIAQREKLPLTTCQGDMRDLSSFPDESFDLIFHPASTLKEWDDNKNMSVKYKIPYSDLDQLPKSHLEKRIAAKEPLEFGHSLEDQIGGQISAGFLIAGFYEDGSGGDLLDPYIKAFIATKAVKP